MKILVVPKYYKSVVLKYYKSAGVGDEEADSSGEA